jgi:hypothetical protein
MRRSRRRRASVLVFVRCASARGRCSDARSAREARAWQGVGKSEQFFACPVTFAVPVPHFKSVSSGPAVARRNAAFDVEDDSRFSSACWAGRPGRRSGRAAGADGSAGVGPTGPPPPPPPESGLRSPSVVAGGPGRIQASQSSALLCPSDPTLRKAPVGPPGLCVTASSASRRLRRLR